MAILGIDLGTTNSACAIWDGDKVQLIPNRLGEFLTPSVVGLDDKGLVTVGKVARDRLISHSDRTVAVFKRLMGSNHQVQLARQRFTATELSALVLKSLKEDAEAFLGQPVTEAVISVPAYFNDNQRQATRLAGELAGFKVERLINEPTAAAIAYGLNQRAEGTFLILDLGGGTFDVSILEFFDGVMEVHASAGDNFLGGEDFNNAMQEALLAELGITALDLSPQQRAQLATAVESSKRRIGLPGDNRISLTLGKHQIDKQIDDDWFAKLATPLLLRAKRPIERALDDAKLNPGAIDEVVLVGGSTRMGLFRATVGRMFGRLPACHIDPDLAIAMGAAIQAGLKAKDAALGEIVLTDVCPYTLGTEVNGPDGKSGGYFLPIIERNSTVPVSVERSVVTASDNQQVVRVAIYQGESRLVANNIYLGELEVPVPPGPEGKERVDIRYSYDMNGLLAVDVTVASTGHKANKVIEQAPGALSAIQKAEALARLDKLKFHPRDQEENRALLARGERVYQSSLGDQRQYVANVLGEFDKVLERQNSQEIAKLRAKVSEMLDQLDRDNWL